MELKKSSNFEDIIGQMSSTSFVIEESAQAIIMDSLINLYSDPIGSIVREAASNCVDAYRERQLKKEGKIPLDAGDNKEWFSNKDTIELEYSPQNTILGTQASFIFKDWGVGLSEDRVKQIYTRFGNSTKRVNNYQIGGFGIGAKAPFAYAETFYVKTRYNGTEYTYMLYRGNDVPQMDLVKKVETTEKNGTHVIVPLVDEYDGKRFKEAIEKQLKYFDNIIYTEIEEHCGPIKKASVDYEDSNCYIDTNSNEASILVGNVEYPIDWSLLETPRAKTYSGIKYRFDVGDLDLVPSRENIRYTEKTKNLILTKIKDVKNTFKKQLIKDLEEETDIANFVAKAYQVKNASDSYYGTMGVFRTKAYLAGHALSADLKFNDIPLNNLDFSKLFCGFELNKVNTVADSRYVGGERIGTTKITGWNELLSVFRHYNEESDSKKDYVFPTIYYVEGTYSRKKDFYITKKLKEEEKGSSFFRFKLKDPEDSGSLSNSYTPNKKFQEAFIKSENVFSYDTLEMSEDEMAEDIGLFESEKDRRKREEKVFYKRLICDRDTYNNTFNSRFKFKGGEAKAVEIEENDSLIIYGFSSDDALLKQVGFILFTHGGEKTWGNYQRLKEYSNYEVFKIAQNVEKNFTNHIYVKDFFMEKHSILKDFYTAELIKDDLPKWDYLKSFARYNEEVYDIYTEVRTFIKNNRLDSQNIIGRDENKEVLESVKALCASEKLVRQNILDKQAFLNEYSQGLELLNFIPCMQGNRQSAIMVKKVLEYLKSQGKETISLKEVSKEALRPRFFKYCKENYCKSFYNFRSFLEQYPTLCNFPPFVSWVNAIINKNETYYDVELFDYNMSWTLREEIEEKLKDWNKVKKAWFSSFYDSIEDVELENFFAEKFSEYITIKKVTNGKPEVVCSL